MITCDDPVSAFAALCEMEPPAVTGQAIAQSEDGPCYERLRTIGALVEVDRSETIICFACERQHSAAVEYVREDKYRYYCPDAGFQAVSGDWLRRFAVRDEWIASTVCVGLSGSASGRYDRIGPALRIGQHKLARDRFELFFAWRIGEASRFRNTTSAIASVLGHVPGVLLTTTPVDLCAGTMPARCALVSLQSVLRDRDRHIVVDPEPLIAALSGSRGTHSGALTHSFSPGFRSGTVRGVPYTFSDKQALVIEALHEAWESGLPRLHQDEIRGKADTSQRVGQLFRKHPAYGTLIKYDGEGFYWLDL